MVSTEAGYVFNLELEPIIVDSTHKAVLENAIGPVKIKWDNDAICFMSNIAKDVSGGANFTKIKFEIMDYAKKNDIKQITIEVIMNAKPELNILYRNPIKDEFEPHHSIVRRLETNPKVDTYF